MTDAAVVILNWNKAELSRHCVEVARAATSVPAEWIVVDNGSTEPFADMDGVTVLRNADNLGFSGGVNTGLRHGFAAGATHVWLLNNDAEPLPGALDRLLEAARADPDIGLASAVILNSDAGDAVHWHGGMWDGIAWHETAEPAEYARWMDTAPERIWLVGTALLVSRRLFERIGGFDEKLFAYWEDNDISLRSAAAGFRNIVVETAFVRHECGAPDMQAEHRAPYHNYYMIRNELLLLRKTRQGLRQIYWMLRRTRRLHQRLHAHPIQRRAVRRAVVDGLLGRGGAYRD